MAQGKAVILSKLSGLSDNTCALLLKVCAEGCDRCNVQKGNRQSNEILVFGMRMLHATLGDLILDLSMICKGEDAGRKAIRGVNPMKSHSRAAVYCDCCTTSNVSVTTWAKHPVEPPTMRKFDASVLSAKKSVTVFERRQTQ